MIIYSPWLYEVDASHLTDFETAFREGGLVLESFRRIPGHIHTDLLSRIENPHDCCRLLSISFFCVDRGDVARRTISRDASLWPLAAGADETMHPSWDIFASAQVGSGDSCRNDSRTVEHQICAEGNPEVNRARKRAARLAVFIECAGLIPILRGSTYSEYCKFLEEQYMSLETQVRRLARVEGRRQLREDGLTSATIRLIPVPPPVCGASTISPKQRQKQRSGYQDKMRHWSPETPPCPKCRIARGMPKRSWPTRELAEEVCSQQNDPDLRVYRCPAQPGFWHLGHRRSR